MEIFDLRVRRGKRPEIELANGQKEMVYALADLVRLTIEGVRGTDAELRPGEWWSLYLIHSVKESMQASARRVVSRFLEIDEDQHGQVDSKCGHSV